jgi:hypothetical protein
VEASEPARAAVAVTPTNSLRVILFFIVAPWVDRLPVEVVEAGAAILTGANQEKILDAANKLLSRTIQTRFDIFGDGHAAIFICQKILTTL